MASRSNDVLTRQQRAYCMSRIQGKNTKPEMAVRSFLHGLGFRYRLHRKDLPGKPDLVLPRFRLAIFVHGCFWHRHSRCFYATSPATRKEFWRKKLEGNVTRDLRQQKALIEQGWRVLVIWECGVRHSDRLNEIPDLITGNNVFAEWPDDPPRKR
ncbi:very short patch repair endonuclease [Halomonas sp. 18H]|nr:very short patch repair endonuclease [Halomonas sp. 18H]MCW4148547.1 very short patch repair endonuclease [Halomonas sp. 18H]